MNNIKARRVSYTLTSNETLTDGLIWNTIISFSALCPLCPLWFKMVYDVIVVGGGLIGLATAREILQRQPDTKLAVLERESQIATQQSGHNSGVIHAGIYYKPGSLKARLCVAGHRAMMDYCDMKGIPYQTIGKVIVALNEDELPRLMDLWERGQANGVDGLRLIDRNELRELEPHLKGIKAIHSPHTGIVDYNLVAHAYVDDIRNLGGEIHTNCQVVALDSKDKTTRISTTQDTFEARFVITCGGLYSDKLREMSDGENNVKIVPFRGSYYALTPEKQDCVNSLIYPVPDPRFPFLGVHFTPSMKGEVWVGPNAVLAFARKGYYRWDVNLGELMDTLTYPGFWKLALRYWKMGSLELFRDVVKSAYVKDVQRYIPTINADDLIAGHSGVRAQALRNNGELVDDFLIHHAGNIAHVQNAPSPGATSSLMIAKYIVDQIEANFEFD